MPQLAELRVTAIDADGNAVVGATVTAYREGASVSASTSGTSPLTIPVYHPGKIKAGDYVFIGTHEPSGAGLDVLGSSPYLVTSVTATSIVISGSFTTVSISLDDRLIPSNNLPTIYQDDQGTVASTNPLITDSSGEARGFVEYAAYDVITSGSGVISRLQEGVVCGTEAPGQVRYADAYAVESDTEGIQEAIDDLPSAGGKVICSAKTYTLNSSVWLHSGVHLEGAGVGSTIIKRASNSIVDASATASGAVINCGPKGSNGTQFSSGTTGSDISLSNLTLDGNNTGNTGLTSNTNVGPVGLWATWVSGLYVDNVKVQNTLQTGYYLSNCADIHFSNFSADTVGQWSVSSDRNAISLHNAGNSSTFTNQGTLSNFYFKTVGDEAITMSGVQNLAVSNGVVDGCDFGIEFTAASSISVQDCTFSNINFRNGIDFGITFNATIADSARVTFSNLNFDFHSSNHDAGVIYLSSSGHNLSDITFSNITATNINSKDSTSRNWIDCQGLSSKTRSRLFFSNINFTGKAASTRTGDVGITLRGPITDCFFTDVNLKDVPGIGIGMDDAAADVISNIHFDSCTIDGCNADGFFLRNDTAAATIKEIYFDHCVTRNVGKQVATLHAAGWVLIAGFAGSSINNIYLRGCRSYKTTGSTHLYGITMTQTAGTLDSIFMEHCDFTGTQTAEMLNSGTITNIRCDGYYVGAAQTITAVGQALTRPSLIKHCVIRLDADNSYTLTSAPTLGDGGFEGQRMTIINEDTVDTITVQDQGSLASSNLRLSAASVALGPRDNLTLIWNGTVGDWVQTGTTNVT